MLLLSVTVQLVLFGQEAMAAEHGVGLQLVA
jgi:hypothetical protein